MNIGERFRRWKRSRGYGVHSPLAYRLVSQVVRPPRDYSYYGEEILEMNSESEKTDTTTVAQARLLLRLVAFIQPSYVWVSRKAPDIFTEAIKLGGSVVRIYDGEVYPDEILTADLAVIYRDKIKKSVIDRFLKPGKTLVGFELATAFVKMVERASKGGVVLEGVKGVIAVATSDPVSHNYRISSF